MNAHMWTKFFEAAGIAPEKAACYADIFFTNKIERNHLPHLNREVLKEMNITLMGHIRLILKHAQVVSDRIANRISSRETITVSAEEETLQFGGIITVEILPDSQHTEENTSQSCVPQEVSVSSTNCINLLDAPVYEMTGESNSEVSFAKEEQLKDLKTKTIEEDMKHDKSHNCTVNGLLTLPTPSSYSAVDELNVSGCSCTSMEVPSRSAISDLKDEPVSLDGVNKLQGCVEDGVKVSVSRAPLLPTPTMPKNWLDPSWKGDSANDVEDKDLQSSEADDIAETSRNKIAQQSNKNKSVYETSSVLGERPMALLPTPLVPQNWLNPSNEQYQLAVDSAKSQFQFDSSVLPSRTAVDMTHYNFYVQSNSATPSNLHTFVPAATNSGGFQGTVGSQKYMPLQQTKQSQYPMQSFLSNETLSSRERNLRVRNTVVPKVGWNSQIRQGQPYSRQQLYTNGSSSVIPLRDRGNFHLGTNTFQAYNISPAYSYGPQCSTMPYEEFIWKHK